MKWSTAIDIPPSEIAISLQDNVWTLGSCFADEIACYLQQRFLRISTNPLGVQFNPVSMLNTIHWITGSVEIIENDLFFHQGIWRHFDVHSKLSKSNPNEMLGQLVQIRADYAHALNDTKLIICTLGTAMVWELEDGRIVANCHKLPGHLFNRRQLTYQEIVSTIHKIIDTVQEFLPQTHMVWTVSPIRHLRDGLVASSRSKATLLTALRDVLDTRGGGVHYFPAYELLMDELRDYRFYASDLVHPSQQAIDYICRKFITTYYHNVDPQVWSDIESLRRRLDHRLMADTDTSDDFISETQALAHRLTEAYGLRISQEI